MMLREEHSKETQDWAKLWQGLPLTAPMLDLDSRLRKIEKQLLILGPSNEHLSKYPALANAYKEYKCIEKLVLGNTNET